MLFNGTFTPIIPNLCKIDTCVSFAIWFGVVSHCPCYSEGIVRLKYTHKIHWLLIKISKTHHISAVLQLSHLAQFTRWHQQKNPKYTACLVYFMHLDWLRVESLSLQLTHTRVCLETDCNHMALIVSPEWDCGVHIWPNKLHHWGKHNMVWFKQTKCYKHESTIN